LALRTSRRSNCTWFPGAFPGPGCTRSSARCGIFYGTTLGRADLPERIAFAREPPKLPVALGVEKVERFLGAVTHLKHRIALTKAFAAGLRATEVIRLKLADIDSSRLAFCRSLCSRRFRQVFLQQLRAACADAELRFSGDLAGLIEAAAFADQPDALARINWVL
jgi:integrase